jgi:bacteriorhodopsin
MKLTFLLTLLVATAAQDGDGAATQSAQTQGADGAGDQAESYGAEQSSGESYGAEQSPGYEAHEEYHHEEYHYHRPKCCVSRCPEHAPYFNKHTCACVGNFDDHYHTESYGGESYGGESYGAQQSYGGEEGQAEYRQLHDRPQDTVDTRNYSIRKGGKIVLWVAFGLLFIAACYYLRMFWYYYGVAEVDGDFFGNLPNGLSSRIYHYLAQPSLIAGFVCLIASLAYLTMATDNGWYRRCDGRQFYFARYIDWLITTPLLLHALCHFSNSPDEIWNFLFFCDIVMIAAGLIASTIAGTEKWIFFGFSILAFIPVIYYLCLLRGATLDNMLYHPVTGLRSGNVGVWLPYVWWYYQYQFMCDLTVIAWFCYPIIWVLAEGTNKISVTAEVVAYAFLDVIAKGVFGYFVVTAEARHFKDNNHRLVDVSSPANGSDGTPGLE